MVERIDDHGVDVAVLGTIGGVTTLSTRSRDWVMGRYNPHTLIGVYSLSCDYRAIVEDIEAYFLEGTK